MRIPFIFLLSTPAFACQAVETGLILGKDLAAASALFSAIEAESVIGTTPMPGVQRIFHAEELLQVARRSDIVLPAPVPELCFERATEPLTAERLLPVLRSALDLDGATIAILDFSRFGVPRGSLAGSLQFTRAGLSAAGLWRGRVVYDENRSMPVWVKARITTEQVWIEAAEPLAPSKPLNPAQLRVARGPRFPFGPAPLASIDLAAGRAPLRSIKAGEPIFASMLVSPREVERGDNVDVEVSSGSAYLSFEAISQSAGRAGELILVRNPESGRYFRARVEGKDKVSVIK
jgi:flagella basal body P-ring formation protein FlgA